MRDDEAEVYYSESDITGLNIEAETLDVFEEVLFDVAPELIMTNHIRPQDFMNTPLNELFPAILWQRPDAHLANA